MITTKTVDLLQKRAHEMLAISDALYEAGIKAEAHSLSEIAAKISNAAGALNTRLEAYARSALNDDPENVGGN